MGRSRFIFACAMLGLCAGGAFGCSASAGSADGVEPAGSDGAAEREDSPMEPAADAGADEPSEPWRERCAGPEGARIAPRSIGEVVGWLNAMPKPLELACFLDTLERPLALHAVNSIFSAQPAQSRSSPRIFLFFDPLILSVVPAGAGAALLEFGEQRSPTHSLKAELEFPITGQLDAAAPYQRLPFNETGDDLGEATITTCGFCHQGEEPAADIALPWARISPALKPQPNQRVPLDELHAELARCDAAAEPERCALLDALLGADPPPQERDFPETYDTFF
jgi:hypothetical protein